MIDTVSRDSPRETRGLSCGRDDGATVLMRRVDAIDAYLKFGNGRKRTLSQHGQQELHDGIKS